jgi:DNA polymerase-3 subunit delta'
MFENIIGNDKAKKTLETSLKQGKLSHSYLFIGIDGIGKKLIAKQLAKQVLCLNKENCNNTCKSCIEFESDNHPDFEIIVPDGNSIKIEQIRNLQKKIQEKPIISEKKIYIIDGADKMTKEAQNCLLKTLEEPPEFAVIILIGNNESLFLETIKSRCIIIHFEKISNENIKKYIEENFGLQNLNENTLKIFQGSIGKANYLKDKIAEYENIEKIIENYI